MGRLIPCRLVDYPRVPQSLPFGVRIEIVAFEELIDRVRKRSVLMRIISGHNNIVRLDEDNTWT